MIALSRLVWIGGRARRCSAPRTSSETLAWRFRSEAVARHSQESAGPSPAHPPAKEEMRMRMVFTWIKRVWCKMVHRRAMWPIHGKYVCPKCLQEYPVYWGDDGLRQPTPASAPPAAPPPPL